jgi:hypothetical protein
LSIKILANAFWDRENDGDYNAGNGEALHWFFCAAKPSCFSVFPEPGLDQTKKRGQAHRLPSLKILKAISYGPDLSRRGQ